MANSWLKAKKIADASLALLESELVLGHTVWNVSGLDWTGTLNDTITIRIPATLTAREYGWRNDRSAAIVFDELTETSYDITIGGHVYSAVKVTDEQLALDIVSFSEQVLSPQSRAVAVKLEDNIIAKLTGAPFKNIVQLDREGNGVVADTTPPATSVTTMVRNDPHAAIVAARKALNAAKVPFGDRALVIGTDMEEIFLRSDQLVRVDQSGSTSALREATIGRIAGFDVVVSQQVAPTVGYAYHRSAVAMALMAPPVPSGVTFGQTIARDGFAMRWIRDYDPAYLQDRSVVSAFYGVQSINDGPNVDLDGAGAGAAVKSNIRAVKIELVS